MKLRFFLVILILVAQVAGIAYLSFLRERERRDNPTIRLQCASYDPRDLLRGHFLPLDFKILKDIPFSKFDAKAREKIRELFADEMKSAQRGDIFFNYSYGQYPDFWLVLAPDSATGLWEVERVTTDNPNIDFNADPHSEKIALRSKGSNYSTMSLRYPHIKYGETLPENTPPLDEQALLFSFENPQSFFPNFRFYVPEKKAGEFDEKFSRNTKNIISAELFLRNDGTPVIKRLFINGEEF